MEEKTDRSTRYSGEPRIVTGNMKAHNRRKGRADMFDSLQTFSFYLIFMVVTMTIFYFYTPNRKYDVE